MVTTKEEAANAKKAKDIIHAPCAYEGWSDMLKRDNRFYPAVNCDYDCEHCGCNPVVALRRKEKMRNELERKKKKRARKKVK